MNAEERLSLGPSLRSSRQSMLAQTVIPVSMPCNGATAKAGQGQHTHRSTAVSKACSSMRWLVNQRLWMKFQSFPVQAQADCKAALATARAEHARALADVKAQAVTRVKELMSKVTD